jgi:hypothetical protein
VRALRSLFQFKERMAEMSAKGDEPRATGLKTVGYVLTSQAAIIMKSQTISRLLKNHPKAGWLESISWEKPASNIFQVMEVIF